MSASQDASIATIVVMTIQNNGGGLGQISVTIFNQNYCDISWKICHQQALEKWFRVFFMLNLERG